MLVVVSTGALDQSCIVGFLRVPLYALYIPLLLHLRVCISLQLYDTQIHFSYNLNNFNEVVAKMNLV